MATGVIAVRSKTAPTLHENLLNILLDYRSGVNTGQGTLTMDAGSRARMELSSRGTTDIGWRERQRETPNPPFLLVEQAVTNSSLVILRSGSLPVCTADRAVAVPLDTLFG